MAKTKKPTKMFSIGLTIAEFKGLDPMCLVNSAGNDAMMFTAIPQTNNSVLISWEDFSTPKNKKK